MEGVLLLANANQELNHRRPELMRPQLNANYRHLCSPSNPVTSLLFGDYLPKAVKDISDTNRLSSKLTKDSNSTCPAKRSQPRPYWQGKGKYDGARNSNNMQPKNYQIPPLQKEGGWGEEERLNSNPTQVSLTTRKFAGGLRHFLPAWSSITTDQKILDIIQHCMPKGLSSAPRCFTKFIPH